MSHLHISSTSSVPADQITTSKHTQTPTINTYPPFLPFVFWSSNLRINTKTSQISFTVENNSEYKRVSLLNIKYIYSKFIFCFN